MFIDDLLIFKLSAKRRDLREWVENEVWAKFMKDNGITVLYIDNPNNNIESSVFLISKD